MHSPIRNVKAEKEVCVINPSDPVSKCRTYFVRRL